MSAFFLKNCQMSAQTSRDDSNRTYYDNNNNNNFIDYLIMI